MENIEKFYVEYGKFIIHFEVINFQLCYNIRKHCTNDKMFSEVLVEYWKPWGLKKTEIVTYPNAPISFLENENTYEFINPETIELPF